MQRIVLIVVGALLLAALAGPAMAQEGAPSVIKPTLIITGMFAVLLVPIGAWFIVTGRAALRQAQACALWPTVTGTVLESRVADRLRLITLVQSSDERHGDDYDYLPVVRYAYEVGGVRHEGDRIEFALGKMHHAGAQKIVDRYVVGQTVPVRVDPADPASAVLETSTRQATWRFWIGIVVAIMPVVLGIGVWLSLRAS